MGTFGTIFDVGHAAGPIVTGLLVASLGYSWAFIIVAAVLVVSVPMFLVTVREELEAGNV
jgi:predicted MFS family arabinose efflux permease